MPSTVEVQITLDSEHHETIGAILIQAGFEGTWSEPGTLRAYIDDQRFSPKELSNILSMWAPGCSFKTSVSNDQNWNKTWEEAYKPVSLGSALLIRASHHKTEAEANYRYEIIIDPRMSFGTGHHPTTLLMAECMLDLPVFQTVLDFGSGTGILSILGEKMGYGAIDAVDIDPNAALNIKENTSLNKCKRIRFFQGDVEAIPEDSYELILANVARNVLLKRLSLFQSLLNDSGHIILSGFFKDDIPVFEKQAHALGMKIGQTLYRNNWASVILVKI